MEKTEVVFGMLHYKNRGWLPHPSILGVRFQVQSAEKNASTHATRLPATSCHTEGCRARESWDDGRVGSVVNLGGITMDRFKSRVWILPSSYGMVWVLSSQLGCLWYFCDCSQIRERQGKTYLPLITIQLWLKSCTTWWAVYLVNYRFVYIPGG